MRRTRKINKKTFKRSAGKCRLCGEHTYELLDVHRIIPGKDGGKYTEDNTVAICANCHRKVHAGDIEIDRWYFSTAGYLLRIVVNGEEKFV
jgi:5-methylcytosine-specific restriction endonuclease McrA